MNPLTNTINTYFAALAITVIGSGAVLIIEHVARQPDTALGLAAGSSLSIDAINALLK